MSSPQPLEKFVECLEFISKHDLPSPVESAGNLLVHHCKNDKLLMRSPAGEVPTDIYTINQLIFREELIKRRTIANELLNDEAVRPVIRRIENWEIRIANLKIALNTYDYNFWPENGYLAGTDEPAVIEKGSVQDQERAVVFISEFVAEVRHLISDPVRKKLKGQIVIALYEVLKKEEGSSVSFKTLYDCWQDIPGDFAIADRLKHLRLQLSPHNLTITISMSNRTAELGRKKIAKGR